MIPVLRGFAGALTNFKDIRFKDETMPTSPQRRRLGIGRRGRISTRRLRPESRPRAAVAELS